MQQSLIEEQKEQPMNIQQEIEELKQAHSPLDMRSLQSFNLQSERSSEQSSEEIVKDMYTLLTEYIHNQIIHASKLQDLYNFAFSSNNSKYFNEIPIDDPEIVDALAFSQLKKILKPQRPTLVYDDHMIKVLFQRPDICTRSLIDCTLDYKSPIFVAEKLTQITRLMIYTFLHSKNTTHINKHIKDALYDLLYFNHANENKQDSDISDKYKFLQIIDPMDTPPKSSQKKKIDLIRQSDLNPLDIIEEEKSLQRSQQSEDQSENILRSGENLQYLNEYPNQEKKQLTKQYKKNLRFIFANYILFNDQQQAQKLQSYFFPNKIGVLAIHKFRSFQVDLNNANLPGNLEIIHSQNKYSQRQLNILDNTQNIQQNIQIQGSAIHVLTTQRQNYQNLQTSIQNEQTRIWM